MLAHIVMGLVICTVRLAWVHFHEYRECRWCRRGGLVGGSLAARMAGHKPPRGRRGGCWRCRGTRLTRRWGAWHTHKLALSLSRALDEWRSR